MQQIIEGIDLSEQIHAIDEDILDLNPPGIYYGSDGLEVRYIKGFRESLMILNQQKIFGSMRLTARDYYNGIELVKDQVKRQQSQK